MSSLGQRIRSIPGWQVTLFLALVALGFLIAAQLRTEQPRVRYTTQERQPLIETTLGLQSQQEQLQTQILALRAQIADAEATTQGSDQLVKQLNDQLLRNRIAAGLVTLEGPGLVLQLDDSIAPQGAGVNTSDYLVSGADVRAVLEELWLAGAEAVSINDERVVPTTAVIDIGGSILVNSAYLAPPYQLKAIGPSNLYQELALSAGWVDFVQARATKFGIRISIAEPPSVIVPAYAGSVGIRYARPPSATAAPTPPSATPAPTPTPRPTRTPKPTHTPRPTP